MSIEDFLETLRARGVQLRVPVDEHGVDRRDEQGELQLVVYAPPGALLERSVGALRQAKAEILRVGYWWESEEGVVTWWGRCSRCGAVVRGGGVGFVVPAAEDVVCVYCL